MRYRALLAATALASALGPPARPAAQAAADARQAILEADREFDRVTAAKGADGWTSFFAENGRMFQSNGQIIAGKKAIREAMAPLFAGAANSLRWRPVTAEVAQSGELGYTTGESLLRMVGADGKLMIRPGRYVTIWRRQPDGSWKVELDIGASGAPKPDPEP